MNCQEVIFSAFNPFRGMGLKTPMEMKDCSFISADLKGAHFSGARMEWTKAPPGEIGEEFVDDEGQSSWIQTYYPPFDRADLEGALFVAAQLKNADFRGADNVLAADFFTASGLETCAFDDDDTKNAVIAASRRKSLAPPSPPA